MKQEIIDYFNATLELEENYTIPDFFFTTSEKCGKLTYLGFKRLKEVYKFHQIDEIDVPETILVYNHLNSKVNGFWYFSKGRKILHSTDKKSMIKLKLHGSSFHIINNKNL